MFNQNEYINNYIKDNYKTIKIRIRNDNYKLINKINNTKNISKYILDLIKKDIESDKKFNFINSQIEIDFELSKQMYILTEKAEDADLQNDYGLYMNIAYAIDALAKKEVSHHQMSEIQWNKLIERLKNS